MKAFNVTLAILATFAIADDSAAAADLPIVLDQNNFYGKVVDLETGVTIGDKPWFIECFAPWCPHCKKLKPTWDELYTRNKDYVNNARIDCTSDTGKPLCNHFKVHGYPTLLFFPLGETKYNEYHGHRNIDAFEAWIHEEMWVDEAEKATNIKPTEKTFMEENLPTTNAIWQSLQDTFLEN